MNSAIDEQSIARLNFDVAASRRNGLTIDREPLFVLCGCCLRLPKPLGLTRNSGATRPSPVYH